MKKVAKLRLLTTIVVLLDAGKARGKHPIYMKYFPMQSENRCAQVLLLRIIISDPLSKETRRITDPMIRLPITQISDPMNPCPECIR